MKTLKIVISPDKLRAVSRIRHIEGRIPEVFVITDGNEWKLPLNVPMEYVLESARAGKGIAQRLVRLAEQAQGVKFDSYAINKTTEWFPRKEAN